MPPLGMPLSLHIEHEFGSNSSKEGSSVIVVWLVQTANCVYSLYLLQSPCTGCLCVFLSVNNLLVTDSDWL